VLINVNGGIKWKQILNDQNQITWKSRADTGDCTPNTIIYFHLQPLSITVLPPCPVQALTPHLKAYYGDPPSSGTWLTYRGRTKAGTTARSRPITAKGRVPIAVCQCRWAEPPVMCQCCQQTCAKQKLFSPHV